MEHDTISKKEEDLINTYKYEVQNVFLSKKESYRFVCIS